MAGVDLPKQTVIYTAGQPMTALHMITSGNVCVKYPGGEHQLGPGDVIGINEIASDVHFLSYSTIDAVNILTYPYRSMDTFQDFLQKHPDVARLFLMSAFRQIASMLSQNDASALSASNLFNGLVQNYQTYREICIRYRVTPQSLPSFDSLDTGHLTESPDIWLSNYYQGLLNTFSTPESTHVSIDAAAIFGFLHKAGQDSQKTHQFMEERCQHLKPILNLYMNESSQDLFAYLTSLFHKVSFDSPESKTILEILQNIMQRFESDTSSSAGLFRQRISSFKSSVISLTASHSSAEQTDVSFIYSRLNDSLSVILNYTGVDDETRSSCHKAFNAYKALPDRTATTIEADNLRQLVTHYFYSLYSIAAVKNLKEGNAPFAVQLFLYYGFMDEELAGAENCQALTRLLQNRSDGTQTGVYTFYDWLQAIYDGKKLPSRNEYEEDYIDYIHKQRSSGTLSDADVRALENNTISKVVFELHNVFPITNKFTFGRLATFCPVFSAENVLKPLNSCYVNASALGQALSRIRAIDFSLFYREIINPNPNSAYRELVHVECLPDIILMPNMGIRGVMWQEIEGKKRSTPSRMMLSIFHMEDLYSSMVKMAGEYRWEMCKRIQGYRWNDVSTRSLTSEYFDYIQFYRKNRALSTEAKERIKNSLQRARNSFKEMFVRDYILWILFESAGSPRLNKVSRGILFNYCPFSASIRTTLKQNPQYSELLHRYDIKKEQKLHHLNQFRKKMLLSNKPIPEEVEAEIIYYNG